MVICKLDKFVYISCQRTGSHSMFRMLRRVYGGKHWKGNGYHGRIPPKKYRKWFTFGTCRNPYSRAVSIWRVVGDVMPGTYGAKFGIYKCVRSKKFEHFAQWLANWRDSSKKHHSIVWPQDVWYKPVKLDAILHLENLSEEFKKMPFFRGPDKIPHGTNRTDKRKPHWTTYYDEGTARLVQRWAGKGFKKFGYRLDSWKDS